MRQAGRAGGQPKLESRSIARGANQKSWENVVACQDGMCLRLHQLIDESWPSISIPPFLLCVIINLIENSLQIDNGNDVSRCRYLIDHVSKCNCGICQRHAVRTQVLRTGFTQIYYQILHNILRSDEVERDYATLYAQWKRSKSPNESDDLFNVYLFAWKAHIQFLGGKKGDRITRFLQRALVEWGKTPIPDKALEMDIHTKMAAATRKNRAKPLPSVSHLLGFHTSQVISPAATFTATNSRTTRRALFNTVPNIDALEDLLSEPTPQSVIGIRKGNAGK